MQIDDTMVVTTGGELAIPDDATPEQVHESLAQLVRMAAQQASAIVLKDKPFYRSFALSSVPMVYEHGSKRMVLVTTIVALMVDPLKKIQAEARQAGVVPFPALPGGKA